MPARRSRDPRRRRRKDDEETSGLDAEEPEIDTAEMEEDDDEPGEVTRCICGHQELHPSVLKHAGDSIDPGLFIQCDSCQVWQHGYCVGFMSEDEVPDVYYCEKCRPERHLIVVRPTGRTSTYYPKGVPKEQRQYEATSTRTPPKERPERGAAAAERAERATRENRRRTMNSRDAEYEETLKRVLEESKGQDDHSADDTNMPPRTRDEYKEDVKAEIRARDAGKSRVGNGADTGDTDGDGGAKEFASVKDKLSNDYGDESAGTPRAGNGAAEDVSDPFDREERKRRRSPAISGILHSTEAPSATSAASDAGASDAGLSTPRRARSRKHSEEDASAADTPKHPKKRQRTRKVPKAAAEDAKEQNSKPRIPPPRSTMNDLQRRVAAILEFVTRTKQDLALEHEERKQLIELREQRRDMLIAESEDPPKVQSFGLFDTYDSNVEAVDGVAKKLVVFEESFGQFSV